MKRLQAAVVALVLAFPAGTFAQSQSLSAGDGAQIPRPASLMVGHALRDGVKKEAVRLAATLAPQEPASAAASQQSWAARHPVFLATLIQRGYAPTRGSRA